MIDSLKLKLFVENKYLQPFKISMIKVINEMMVIGNKRRHQEILKIIYQT